MSIKLNPVFQNEGEGENKGMYLREGSDYYDLTEIENQNTKMAHDELEAAKTLMMSGTTPTNPLVNKDFVNSSISHMAANPRGNWPNWNAVPTDPSLYPANADGDKKPSNNDYMVVQDMTGYTNPEEPTRTYEGTWRFTYVGEWDDVISGGTRGKSGWKPIYRVNEKPMTAEQVAALNSGATEAKITSYDNHVTNTNNPHSVTKAQIGLGSVDNTSDLQKPVSTLQQIELNKKVNIAQGSENANKILQVDSNGDLVLTDPPEGGGGDVTQKQLDTKIDKTLDIKRLALVTELPQAIDLYTMYCVVEEEGEWPGLKITNTDASKTLLVKLNGINNTDEIYYSSDGKNWTKLTTSGASLSPNSSLYFWNKKDLLESSDSPDFKNFRVLDPDTDYTYESPVINISGNIQSMKNFEKMKGDKKGYRYLFDGLTSLINASQLLLPENKLYASCYSGMFAKCVNLVNPPKLPATELANYCYDSMFMHCMSLATAPDLPATNLEAECYSNMFYGCSALTSVKLYANNVEIDGNTPYTLDWLDGVAANGTLYYNGQTIQNRGPSTAPLSWAIQSFTP